MGKLTTALPVREDKQIVPLTPASIIRDRSIKVPPSLFVTSISVDGEGIGQYGTEAR
jgi:hypothetical protein